MIQFINLPASFTLDNVIIRILQKRDLPALEWQGEYIHYRKLFAQVFIEAENGHAVLWIAESISVGLIGQAFVQLFSINRTVADGFRRAYIHGVRVKPLYRNFGLGSLLMEKAENDLIMRGFQEVVLNVNKTNYQALSLYERLGYRILGPDSGEWSYMDHLGQIHLIKEPAWKMIKTISNNK